MAAHDIDTVLDWRGRDVLDRDGERIGTFGEVYLDRRTELPAWAGVRTGLLGRKESLVPLDEVQDAGDELRVPWEKDRVTGAPSVDADVELDADGERQLFEHYGRAYDDDEPAAREAEPAAREAEAPATADDDRPAAPDAGSGADVVRSEEVPVVTGETERRPVERVRLKKVLVTDHVERKVPVRREVVEVTEEPPAGERPGAGEPREEG